MKMEFKAKKTIAKKAIAPGMLITIILVLLVGAALFVIFFSSMFPNIFDSVKEILGMGQSYAKLAPDVDLEAFKKDLAENYAGKGSQLTLHIFGSFDIKGQFFDEDFAGDKLITGDLYGGAVKRMELTNKDISDEDKNKEVLAVDEISRIELRLGRNIGAENARIEYAVKENPIKGDRIVLYAAYYDKKKDEYGEDNAKPVLELIYYGAHKINDGEGMYIEYEIKPYFDVNEI